MRACGLCRWLTVIAMLVLPVLAYAQGEATLSGTVTDSTGGALPGVTVRAVHEASGNSFEAVTDERGDYRMPVRVGAYRVTAELSGFAPVTQSLTLLVGQQAVVNLQMALSGVQESVTVTGEAPLLNVTESSLGGNIDARQMEELPLNGRNWMDLVLMAPGARANHIEDSPVARGGSASRGDYQLNVDGQQITAQMSYAGTAGSQPSFSRDAIAEFEYISSRFDATQGRSAGVQVNAITKSGTNVPSGTFAGYFRDDRFNAADNAVKRVLPYSNQQLSGTFGGPIRKDQLHFFAYYEHEREPRTIVYTTPYPHFNRDLTRTVTQKKAGSRVDAQFSPRNRLSIRGSMFQLRNPLPDRGSGSSTPMAASGLHRNQYFLQATMTQVLSNRAVNEVKVGGFRINFRGAPLSKQNSLYKSGWGGPAILLRGLSVGGGGRPEKDKPSQEQTNYSVRDDFTFSFAKGGRHTLKLGGEYIHMLGHNEGIGGGNGTLDARGGPIPANIESLFPDLYDANTWNLAPLSPISLFWRESFGNFQVLLPRYIYGAWLQDDWTVTPRLTLNLGVRYDLEANAFANKYEYLPFIHGNRPNDTNNIGPRGGFSFSLNDRTVLRGGYGYYFGTVTSGYFTVTPGQQVLFATLNDGRPDFASNPFNGRPPTFAELEARKCTPALEPGCIRNEASVAGTFYDGSVMPHSHQVSIGLQRQLGTTMAFEADYVFGGTRNNLSGIDPNVNMTYNPATGANYPFTDISRRVAPWWGLYEIRLSDSRSNYHALQTSFTKRMSQGWQLNGTYTLGALRDAYQRAFSGDQLVPFPTAPDMGGDYGPSVTDQRHRATLNGIWELPYNFQVSGLYFYGSGARYETRWGVDLRNMGGTGEQRLRPDGTIVPRNSFEGRPIHRVDLRVQRRFPLGGRVAVDGLAELFNAFNHGNFGSYAGIVTAAGTVQIAEQTGGQVASNYGKPEQNPNVVYGPRTAQLGFRLTF